MSIYVSTRVWSQSKSSGANLLMLLALADRADEEGVCWPGVDTLAERARVTTRQIQYLLAKSEAAGEIYVERRSGRKNTNRYFVVVGLDAKAIAITLMRRFNLTQIEAHAVAQKILKAQNNDEADCTISSEKGEVQRANGEVSSKKGEVQRAKKVKPTSPDSSINTSAIETSADSSAVAEARAPADLPDSADAAAAEPLFQEILAAGLGLTPKTRAWAACDWITPDYVRAHALKFARDHPGKSPGLLVAIIESREQAPDLNANRHLVGCFCLDCRSAGGPEDDPAGPPSLPSRPAPPPPPSDLDPDALAGWQQVLAILQQSIPKILFEDHLLPVRLLAFDPEARILTAQAPDSTSHAWLTSRFQTTINRQLWIAGRPAEIRFIQPDSVSGDPQ